MGQWDDKAFRNDGSTTLPGRINLPQLFPFQLQNKRFDIVVMRRKSLRVRWGQVHVSSHKRLETVLQNGANLANSWKIRLRVQDADAAPVPVVVPHSVSMGTTYLKYWRVLASVHISCLTDAKPHGCYIVTLRNDRRAISSLFQVRFSSISLRLAPD